MKKLLTNLSTTWNMVVAMKEEFHRRRIENHKILIQGSVLDPDNHPSYNKTT